MLLSKQTLLGLRMTSKYTHPVMFNDTYQISLTHTALSFIGVVNFLFSLPDAKNNKLVLLSNTLCQDPLEQFFGCQRQRGSTSDNPNTLEFCQNTQALRIVDSFCRGPIRGNCRKRTANHFPTVDKENTVPLPKRPRKH